MNDIKTNDRGEPERIYLQLHGDADPADYPGQIPPLDEATWCASGIFEHDIEYVRADIFEAAAARVAELEAENGRMRSALERIGAWACTGGMGDD